MRIGVFIERFNPTRGGRERSTAEIARGLVARGCEVDVICTTGSEAGEGVNVVPLGKTLLRRTVTRRRFVLAAQEMIAAGTYDVTHTMLPIPTADIYQLRSGTLPGSYAGNLRPLGPLLRCLRRLTWQTNRLRALQGRLEAQVIADPRTRCLPVSRMVAEELRRHYDRTENVRVVFNGVAVPNVPEATRAEWRARLRSEWGVPEEDLLLVCPAMNFLLKGVAQTVRAFSRFMRRRNGAHLVVLGREMAEGYERLVGAAGIGQFVRFRQPVDDIWPVYAAADAVVLLSWYDPCSRVVLEATAFGTPCVTTAFNGAAEALGDGAGVVVDSPADLRAVVDAMTRLADPAERRRLADACRTVAPRLTMDRHVDELMEIYKEIAAS